MTGSLKLLDFQQKYKFPDCILSQFHNTQLAAAKNISKIVTMTALKQKLTLS